MKQIFLFEIFCENHPPTLYKVESDKLRSQWQIYYGK